MGGLSSPLALEDITATLRVTRGQIATVATIANRLERGVSIVQRALDQMLEGGMVQLVPTHKGDQYRLIAGAPSSDAVIHPYQERRPPVSDGDDQDDGGEVQVEHIRAAALWRTRMGMQRWKDDPRALGERMQQQHCIPPFYHTAAREI